MLRGTVGSVGIVLFNFAYRPDTLLSSSPGTCSVQNVLAHLPVQENEARNVLYKTQTAMTSLFILKHNSCVTTSLIMYVG